MSVNHYGFTNWPVFSSTQLIEKMAEVADILLLFISFFLDNFELNLAKHWNSIPCIVPFHIDEKVPITIMGSVFYTINL
jgi:hypothetical protein